MYLRQERGAERWRNPLSSRLDRMSRRHVILGPLMQSVSLFALLSLVSWALFGFYLFVVGLFAVGACLLLMFNLGYYRWLTRRHEGPTCPNSWLSHSPGDRGSADVSVLGQRRLAVVRVTTSGLVTTSPKSFRMKDSISSSKPTRSDSSII
jgi:hypothetical protein